MDDEEEGPQTSPHVLIFPLPAQGHVNSMLKLAELLALAGLNVTFLNSDFVHQQLLRHTDVVSRFLKYAGFEFRTITDGLPDEHPRAGHGFMQIFETLESITKPVLKEMLVNMKPRVDCLLADGVLGIAVDVAQELGIPIIQFRTISACCTWAYFAVPDMMQAGELPIRDIEGQEDMDRLITSVPGMETFLRCRDLPGFCRVMDSTLQRISEDTRKNFQGHGLLLNTFEDLEGDILSHMRTKTPKIYTVGPLHLHLRARLCESNQTLLDQSSNSFYQVDRSCLSWLDKQPKGSVVYVSFGSLTVLSSDQVFEFWFGLVNSKMRFLWVLRPGIMPEKDHERNNIPVELIEGTKERGCIVSWAPQEEVLGHEATGGFLTHSGWNSTLESVTEGVPMICWPYFADQQINSRFVSQVWGLGLDMKDLCDRKIVEKMVNALMVERREEFLKSAIKMAKLARECVNVGGSSYCNLNRLVEDIRSMNINVRK